MQRVAALAASTVDNTKQATHVMPALPSSQGQGRSLGAPRYDVYGYAPLEIPNIRPTLSVATETVELYSSRFYPTNPGSIPTP